MATEQGKVRQLEITDYLRIAQKRKAFVGLVTAAAIIVGGLYAASSETLYRASALVLVRQQPRGFFWGGDQATMMPTVAMSTYARIGRSIDVAERTARKLQGLPSGERVIASGAEVRGALTVTVIEPDLLRIDASSPDENEAVQFANRTAESFVDANMEMRRTESEAARVFLEEQVAQAKAELDLVVRESVNLSREVGMVDVEAEASAAVAELREYDNQRRRAWSELQQAGAEVARLEEALASEPEITVQEQPAPNPAWAAVNSQLTSARLALSDLQAQYTDDHPGVQNARARAQELTEQLANTPELLTVPEVRRSGLTGTLRQQLAQAQVKLKVIEARHSALQSIISDLRDRTRDLPEERQQWQSLSDRAALARGIYQNLLEELRQAKLTEAIKRGNAMVVDTAQDGQLLRASLGRALAFAGMLGLFSGVALALLLEALDDTISTPEDLTRITDLRFLGVIPLRAEGAKEELVTIGAPKSPPAEAYRTLRSNIRFALFDQPAKSFVVCSAGAGEGKSLTAANLGVACAQGGDAVIIVDTDLRRPILHRLFNSEASPGLTNALVGEQNPSDILHDTAVPGLRLLPTGPLPPNPAELLDSEQMDEVIAQLSSEADIVILDSPPALMLTDAGILASKVDRTIVVTEAGQVTERAFADLMRIFDYARANVLGVVLNKLRVGAGDYYYYYYYDYDEGERQRTAEAGGGRLEAGNDATRPS